MTEYIGLVTIYYIVHNKYFYDYRFFKINNSKMQELYYFNDDCISNLCQLTKFKILYYITLSTKRIINSFFLIDEFDLFNRKISTMNKFYRISSLILSNVNNRSLKLDAFSNLTKLKIKQQSKELTSKHFTKLKELNIRKCNNIPIDIKYLTNLVSFRHSNIANANLLFSFMRQLESLTLYAYNGTIDLIYNTKLTKLFLSCGYNNNSVTKNVDKLLNLVDVYLFHTHRQINFDGRNIEILTLYGSSIWLMNLKKINHLVMIEINYFQVLNANDSFEHLTHLKCLNLENFGNNLYFPNMTKLQILTADYNDVFFTDHCAMYFHSLTKLEIQLKTNKIDLSMVSSLKELIIKGNDRKLNDIILPFNLQEIIISSIVYDFRKLSFCINNLTNLHTLNLGNVSEEANQYSNIVLDNNFITHLKIEHLNFLELKSLTNLRQIYFKHGSLYLGQNCQLNNLTELYVNHVKFGDNINKLQSLIDLYVLNCNNSKIITEKFNNLTYLCFNGKRIRDIKHLINLKRLKLASLKQWMNIYRLKDHSSTLEQVYTDGNKHSCMFGKVKVSWH